MGVHRILCGLQSQIERDRKNLKEMERLCYYVECKSPIYMGRPGGQRV